MALVRSELSARGVLGSCDARNKFQERYRDDAVEALTTIEFFDWEYGEVEFDVPPEEEEALQAAFHQMIIDWNSDNEGQKALLTELLSVALKSVSDAPVRVASEHLVHIVEIHPLKLQNVCQFILARKSEGESWADLARLADLGRQSPWAKLHILTTAGQLDAASGEAFDALISWATMQLSDRHETVRAESAWLLAKLVPDVVTSQLPALFQKATGLSRPALAAAAAKALGGNKPGPAGISMRDEGALTKAAWKWGLTA